jgi:hypothetical protein
MIDGIARWLKVTGSVDTLRNERRRKFDSFPGDRLGNNKGLRDRLRLMLGALMKVLSAVATGVTHSTSMLKAHHLRSSFGRPAVVV